MTTRHEHVVGGQDNRGLLSHQIEGLAEARHGSVVQVTHGRGVVADSTQVDIVRRPAWWIRPLLFACHDVPCAKYSRNLAEPAQDTRGAGSDAIPVQLVTTCRAD